MTGGGSPAPFLRAASAAVVLIALLAHPASAASGIAYLGEPTSARSPVSAFPLGGFRRAGKPWRVRHRAVFLWIGTDTPADQASSAERWPVVKALGQFGTFSGLSVAHQDCFHEQGVSQSVCLVPTFNWDHARYTSAYVRFDHKELLKYNGKLYQHLSKAENRYWVRYAERRVSGKSYINIWATVNVPEGSGSRGLPVVVVGGYLQTQSQIVLQSDFEQLVPMSTAIPNSPGTAYTAFLFRRSVRTSWPAGIRPPCPT